MSHARVCRIEGVSEDEQCPKGAVLIQLKKKLDDMENCRTREPILARLHVTSEACTCWKKKSSANPALGKKNFPLQTLVGDEAHPGAFTFKKSVIWNPPFQSLQKAPHKYMPCYGGHEPPTKNCNVPDCQFSIHLDNKEEKPHECCYVKCEHDKPGFRDWRPKHICNYAGVCKASCFDHPKASDYYNVEPAIRKDPIIN